MNKLRNFLIILLFCPVLAQAQFPDPIPTGGGSVNSSCDSGGGPECDGSGVPFSVPEPEGMILLGVGLLALLATRSRKPKNQSTK